jgi:hypothetical protein
LEPKVTINEKNFRWELFVDEMATEKLYEGIRKFAEDTDILRNQLKQKLSEVQLRAQKIEVEKTTTKQTYDLTFVTYSNSTIATPPNNVWII